MSERQDAGEERRKVLQAEQQWQAEEHPHHDDQDRDRADDVDDEAETRSRPSARHRRGRCPSPFPARSASAIDATFSSMVTSSALPRKARFVRTISNASSMRAHRSRRAGERGSDLVRMLAGEFDAVEFFLLDLGVDLLLDVLAGIPGTPAGSWRSPGRSGTGLNVRLRAVVRNREHVLVGVLEDRLQRRITHDEIGAPGRAVRRPAPGRCRSRRASSPWGTSAESMRPGWCRHTRRRSGPDR